MYQSEPEALQNEINQILEEDEDPFEIFEEPQEAPLDLVNDPQYQRELRAEDARRFALGYAFNYRHLIGAADITLQGLLMDAQLIVDFLENRTGGHA